MYDVRCTPQTHTHRIHVLTNVFFIFERLYMTYVFRIYTADPDYVTYTININITPAESTLLNIISKKNRNIT